VIPSSSRDVRLTARAEGQARPERLGLSSGDQKIARQQRIDDDDSDVTGQHMCSNYRSSSDRFVNPSHAYPSGHPSDKTDGPSLSADVAIGRCATATGRGVKLSASNTRLPASCFLFHIFFTPYRPVYIVTARDRCRP